MTEPKFLLWEALDQTLSNWLNEHENGVDRDYLMVRLHQLAKQDNNAGVALKAIQMLQTIAGEIKPEELGKPLFAYSLQELIIIQTALQKELSNDE